MEPHADPEIIQFFSDLGEIWRDITALEFLMRCSLTQKDGEREKFPLPPYEKNKVYQTFPKSFTLYSFQDVVDEFRKKFATPEIPQEIVDFRDAMAHGVIAEIDRGGVNILLKFRKRLNEGLKIEFSLELTKKELNVRKNLVATLRRQVMALAGDS